MKAAAVYRAILAVSRAVARAELSKRRADDGEGYSYWAVDDIREALAPILVRHRLCVLPRVLQHHVSSELDATGMRLARAEVRMCYTVLSALDGSGHDIEAIGEALDATDKASSKAVAAAFKNAFVQLFGIVEGERRAAPETSRRPVSNPNHAIPVQGWTQWTADICDMIGICETEEATTRVQATYRATLRTLSRQEPQLYLKIGEAVTRRRKQLSVRETTPPKPREPAQIAEVVSA